jgi:glycosyltransferase involved in cell wall biosynthesis
MKVLHVIPGLAQRYGGPSRAVIEMCRALAAEGVEVLLATTDADGPRELDVTLERETVYEGVPAIFFRRQFSEAFKYSRPLARWLDDNVKRFDVAHIHAVFSHSSIAAAKSCRKSGAPYAVRPLGSLAPWSLNHKRLRKAIFWRLGVKQMLDGAAAFHYTAKHEQELAEQAIGARRGVVIPLGLDLTQVDEGAEFAPPAWGAGPYALALSRLHPVKGLEPLLEAFLALTARPEFAHWKLVLAGAGEAGYVASLRRLAEERQGAARVVFAGWLEGAEKESALRHAALLALTSHQENFGLCVAEAWARGVPTLVSEHVGLAPDVAEGGVGWVSALNVNDLTATLETAMRDKKSRAAKGELARKWAGRYSWAWIARNLGELYESLALKKNN